MGGALGAFGKKPDEVQLKAINPLDSANQALDIGLSTLPKAEQLASAVNTFNQNELDQLLEKALPGGPTQIKQNIMAELKGQLPPDVLAQIARATASRSSAGGFSGTGFGNALGAQDLGLASLNLTERGLNSASRWLAQSAAPLMDVSRSFFTPQQLLGFNVNERNLQYEADRTNAGIRAAPDPATAQLAQGFDNFFKTWSSVGMGALGGGGGTMGGNGGGGASAGRSLPSGSAGTGQWASGWNDQRWMQATGGQLEGNPSWNGWKGPSSGGSWDY